MAMSDLFTLGKHILCLGIYMIGLLIALPGTLITVSYDWRFIIAQFVALTVTLSLARVHLGKQTFGEIIQIAKYGLLLILTILTGLIVIGVDGYLASAYPGLALLLIAFQLYLFYKAIRWTGDHPPYRL